MSGEDDAADDPIGDLGPSWDQLDSLERWHDSLDDPSSAIRQVLNSPDLLPASADREGARIDLEAIEKALEAEQAEKTRQLAKAVAEELRSEPAPQKRVRTSTTREDRLSVVIVAALEALRARLRREPKAAEVFAYLEEDPTGIVVDSTDEKLTWVSEGGTLHDTKRKTVANRISRLRKAT